MQNNNITRRSFLSLTAGSLAASVTILHSPLTLARNQTIKAVAFDAFPIFDPRSIFKLVKTLYPAQGETFAQLWRTRIFEYTWLRVSAHQYRDFSNCIEDALQFTARQLQINVSAENHKRLMSAFLQLRSYPDVIPALAKLKAKGIKLAFLSNMTEHMLKSNISNNGLEKYFDYVISTDKVQSFKPDPRAYQLGIDTMGVKKEELAFVAFASWDATGARWFGYPTVWVNRLNFTEEQLHISPSAKGNDISTLMNFVES